MHDNLSGIFDKLKAMCQKYEGPLVVKKDSESEYELWSVKDVVVAGRKMKEIYFVSLVIQKNYVGFYYMPVYVKPEMRDIFDPKFAKLLKGKSCFQIKSLDADVEKQIELALEKGYELYKEQGWVD